MDKTKTHHGLPVKDWLIKSVTIEEAEAEHIISEADSARWPDVPIVPFGYINHKWLEMKEHMQEGDELWTFDSPLKYWQALFGAKGIALVRKGEIVEILMTSMN